MVQGSSLREPFGSLEVCRHRVCPYNRRRVDSAGYCALATRAVIAFLIEPVRISFLGIMAALGPHYWDQSCLPPPLHREEPAGSAWSKAEDGLFNSKASEPANFWKTRQTERL
jgi:hypothetical protein